MSLRGFYTTAEEALRGADLTGKVAIVTGGNSGLGAETVRVLAGAGADVILCARSVAAGQQVADGIAKAAASKAGGGTPALGKITVVPLDLADLKSVAAFALHPAVASLPAIHLLVLNAGIMGLPTRQETKQGFEAQWGTNHVGHQYLAQLLLPKMQAQGAPARVVALTSVGHNFAKELPLDDLNWERRRYDAWGSYGQSKLSNALFARELARRMEEQGVPIKAYSVHPGFINTPLSRDITGGAPLRLLWRAISAVPGVPGLLGSKTVPQGAATTVFACVAPELEGLSGEYLADCQVGSEVPGVWGRRCCHPSALARDGQLARGLWEKTEAAIAAALAK
ncbi:short-chain dehydrogenase reductase SDR [Micractinium conductrix]|uniref:Short-chain dehydrogenase reductase SDR n=1 Tax=Micractinium conductrix TaxID=554055 RepID=A0A2P6V1T1_9CHLO|nr:short-chain dehydrogenase reductase SDR [Micractinium conductrix]|eukprot:PSC68042.1 short-chain dehydrogenase reductase SDR [Micractinium conductrix]